MRETVSAIHQYLRQYLNKNKTAWWLRLLGRRVRSKPDYRGLEVARPLTDVFKLHVGIHNFSIVDTGLYVDNVASNAGADFALSRQHHLKYSKRKIEMSRTARSKSRTVISLEETIVNSSCSALENLI